MTQGDGNVGIIIPAHNVGNRIGQMLEELSRVCNFRHTICVVDDCSTDTTARVAREFTPHIVSLEENCGVGAATKKGYEEILSLHPHVDLVIKLDGDGQHNPAYVPEVVRLLRMGSDFVMCSRFHPESKQIGTPPNRRILNATFACALRLITGWNEISDARTGFMGMTRFYAECMSKNLTVKRYGIPIEQIIEVWCQNPDAKISSLAHEAVYGSHRITPEHSDRYQKGGEKIADQVARFHEARMALEHTLRVRGLSLMFEHIVQTLAQYETTLSGYLEILEIQPTYVVNLEQIFINGLMASVQMMTAR
jgi:glycosyltransferase involved in cell wall biosynthesis